MEQEELERRVKQIFERQGFEVCETVEGFKAEKDGEIKNLQVFSSEGFSAEEVRELADERKLVFVDEEMEELAEDMDISIIRTEQEEEDYDLPSYELIGDVAVIKELTVPEEEAVEGILEHHPHVETILLKQEPLSGEFRIGEYEKLYGDETETVHKEFGCRYKVDPTKAYFSERLATERKRVADLVGPGEKVLVIGAGVGPYPILIARKSEAEKVVAVEKNPEAFEYLEQNIELNSVEEIVEAVEGDAREVSLDSDFDRVIIAVPEFAEEFLDTAVRNLSPRGMLHYYRFLEDGNWEELEQELEETGRRFEVLERTICGHRGPSVDRVCLDVTFE